MIDALHLRDKTIDVTFILQLITIIAVVLDLIGIKIPLLRQSIGFLYLSFVPGNVILRLLKINNLSIIERILYSTGLSLGTLMLLGFVINIFYPIFGIDKPLSNELLIATIWTTMILLYTIGYFKGGFPDTNFYKSKNILSPSILSLLLIPFLAIFGTYLLNYYHTNALLMFLLSIISLAVILLSVLNVSERLFPVAIWVISTALLLHRSLISNYITGWDVHTEYYLANLVNISSAWDVTIPDCTNSMLSITMLAPIYSKYLNMDLTWVFKVIYPLLYSFVPLGLYHSYKALTNPKIAFLSSFFFVSIPTFFGEMLGLARQMIAELYLVLLTMLIVDKVMPRNKKSVLMIIYSLSLIVSHYGTSYLFMFASIFTCIVLALFKSIQALRNEEHKYLNNLNFTILFIVSAFAWYMYTSLSYNLEVLANFANHVLSKISSEFLNPEASKSLYLLTSSTRYSINEITKALNIISQTFTLIGVIKTLLDKHYKKYSEYYMFAIAFLSYLVFTMPIPQSSIKFGITRVYHISTVFLSPFCILGGTFMCEILLKVYGLCKGRLRIITANKKAADALFLSFLVSLFLFNSGFVQQFIEPASSMSVPLKFARYAQSDIVIKTGLSSEVVFEQDVYGAKWISTYKKESVDMYADYISEQEVLRSYGAILWKTYSSTIHYLSNNTKINSIAYIYLRYLNVVEGAFVLPVEKVGASPEEYIFNITEITPLLEEGNTIYTNAGSEIYFYKRT